MIDVVFDLIGVCAAVDIDFFDAGVGQEFEGVFYQRRVCKREEALAIHEKGLVNS